MKNIYHQNASLRHQSSGMYFKPHVRIAVLIAILVLLMLIFRLLCPLRSSYYNMKKGMNIVNVMALFPKWTLANANLWQSRDLWVLDITNDSMLVRIIHGSHEHICCYFNKSLKLEKACYVPECGGMKDDLNSK